MTNFDPAIKAASPTVRHKWLTAISVLIIAGFFLFPPITILDKTHAIGYAICHQAPSRTFHIAGVPLPLCARCTGIYLGALVGLAGVLLLKRQRAIDLPPTPILTILVSFIVIMLFDGLNSFLDVFPWLPQLYPSQNWLRLTTGAFHGLALSVIAYPVMSISVWHPSQTKNEAIIENFKEFSFFLVGTGVVIFLVLWQHPLLLYPLSILSTLGLLFMLGMINTVLVLAVSHREAFACTWRDIAIYITMGLAVSFLLIGGMDWFRAAITQTANLQF